MRHGCHVSRVPLGDARSGTCGASAPSCGRSCSSTPAAPEDAVRSARLWRMEVWRRGPHGDAARMATRPAAQPSVAMHRTPHAPPVAAAPLPQCAQTSDAMLSNAAMPAQPMQAWLLSTLHAAARARAGGAWMRGAAVAGAGAARACIDDGAAAVGAATDAREACAALRARRVGCMRRLASPAPRAWPCPPCAPLGAAPARAAMAVGWRCSARYMGRGDAALSQVRLHGSLFPSQDDPGQIGIDQDSALLAPFVSDTVNLLIAPQEHTHQRPLTSFLLGTSTEEIQSVAVRCFSSVYSWRLKGWQL
jgi:hypothetical protein